MRKILTLLLLLTAQALCYGQSFEDYAKAQKKAYSDYVKKDAADFKAYRDKVNAEYAEMMSRDWSDFDSAPPQPQPQMPEPPEPTVVDPDEKAPEPAEIPIAEVTPAPAPAPTPEQEPKPLIEVPKKEPAPQIAYSFNFEYYGTKCGVNIDDSHRILLSDVSEEAVSNSWTKLSGESFDALVTGCIEWKQQLGLSDWGYVRFVEKLTDSFYGERYANEAKVMQFYLLIQSGYEARIARSSKTLFLLLPFESEIYEYSYLPIDNHKYYIISAQNAKGQSYAVFNQKFPQERRLSLLINSEPKLTAKSSATRKLASKRYPDVTAQLSVNKNLIDFYNEFPRNNSWDLYSKASLSSQAKAELYPALKQSIANKVEVEQVDILLNFVQTAFEYKTDDEQFGQERPLFADESIFYPYCDCEDSSILFSILVQELVGLDVVLVHYPEHLAAAVKFSSSVSGDYLSVDGEKFTICDPTYIGAEVGRSMPQYKSSGATVIKLM